MKRSECGNPFNFSQTVQAHCGSRKIQLLSGKSCQPFSREFSIFGRSEIFTKLSSLTMSIDVVGVESVHRGFGGAPVRSCWSSLPAPVALGYPDSEEA